MFSTSVALSVAAAVPSGWEQGDPPPAPLASRPVVVCALAAVTVLDTTNVPKTILDACEGTVFYNDASVRAASQVTLRGRLGPVLVGFARLDAGAALREIVEAHTILHTEIAELFIRQARPSTERLHRPLGPTSSS